MDRRFELYLKLKELKKDLDSIPVEEWERFKIAFHNYKRVQAEYIMCGGCLIL